MACFFDVGLSIALFIKELVLENGEVRRLGFQQLLPQYVMLLQVSVVYLVAKSFLAYQST
jgi:hypothetical protein